MPTYAVFQQQSPRPQDRGEDAPRVVEVGTLEADSAEDAIRQAARWPQFWQQGRNLGRFPMVQARTLAS